jgi:hypothetical protein
LIIDGERDFAQSIAEEEQETLDRLGSMAGAGSLNRRGAQSKGIRS